MRYVIVYKDRTAHSTYWFDEDKWESSMFCVIDYDTQRITFNGVAWEELNDNKL